MRARLSVLSWFVFGLLCLHGAESSAAEMPFAYREGLIWLRVSIAGSDAPLNFLLDTGASSSVVNLSTLDRLGYPRAPRVRVAAVESTVDGCWPQKLQVTANGITLPREYLALDLGKLSNACDQPVDGLLGADFLRDRVVQIDFTTSMIRILDAKTRIDGEVLPLKTTSSGVRTKLSVDKDKSQWVRVDTGCATALQWVSGSHITQATETRAAVAFTDLRVPTTECAVRLGSFDFQNVPVGLHAHAIFSGEGGLLGNGLLSRFSRVTLDGCSHRLILEKQTTND